LEVHWKVEDIANIAFQDQREEGYINSALKPDWPLPYEYDSPEPLPENNLMVHQFHISVNLVL